MRAYFIINNDTLEVLESFRDGHQAEAEYNLLDKEKYTLGTSDTYNLYQDELTRLLNNEPQRAIRESKAGAKLKYAELTEEQKAAVQQENESISEWIIQVKRMMRSSQAEILKNVISEMYIINDYEADDLYLAFKQGEKYMLIDYMIKHDNIVYRVDEAEFKEFLGDFHPFNVYKIKSVNRELIY